MSDLVGNPEDRFSHNEAHILTIPGHANCDTFLEPVNKEEKHHLAAYPMQVYFHYILLYAV